MCLHGLDICQCGCYFSPFCVRQLLRFNILTWPRMSKFLSRIVRTIHGRVLQEWTRCMFYKCLYSVCRPCFLVSLVPLARIQQLCPLFGLHANIVEEYVLLSALLHYQSCLQSSPCFQHQFVWLPFSRTLVCKGGCSFHVHGSTRVVSSSLCYVAVSRAHENIRDKPLLDVIIIDCLCHYH